MKARGLFVAIVVVLLAAIVGVSYWIWREVYDKSPAQVVTRVTVPQVVREKYDTLAEKYMDSLGASLAKCNSDKGEVYVAGGFGGFTGITEYYDLDGNHIGTFESTDVMLNANRPRPPVTVDSDSCDLLLETKGAALQ